MDVRTALLSTVSFPLSETQAEMIAVKRGLDVGADFSAKIGQSKPFELAQADVIRAVLLSPNVSEGGVSISYTDRKTLLGLANSIYSKYGEPLVKEGYPTVTPIED